MKRTIISGAVLALAIAGTSTGNAAPAVYKVTGGGQITTADTMGAGNTIAFNAQSAETSGDSAKGQVQYIDRSAGTGRAQEKFHGVVTCVTTVQASEDMPAMARIQGQMRGDASTSPVDFTIDVIDNGQGSAAEMDMIAFRPGGAEDADDDGDTSCDTDDDFDADGGLGRGNVKIHKDKA